MSELQNHRTAEAFVRDLRRALYRLYDPGELRRNHLFQLLGPEIRGSPIALRDLIADAIIGLKPGAGSSPASDAWRTYRILFHRFVEQFSQAEVATSLGLSIRQLRRNETQALQTLAEVVWTRYDLANRYGAPQSAMAEQSLITGAETEEEEDILPEVPAPLADEQELAWLSQSLPCQPGTVQELVCGTLKTAEPLLQALAVRLTSHLPDQLPRVAIQATSMRQALLILLTEAGRFASCGEIVLNATVEPGHVVLTVRATGTLAKTIYAGPDNLSDRLEVAKQLVTLSGGVLETTGICDAPGFTARLFLPTVTQLTVLFIDDNTDTLQLYQRYLAGTPYHALGARDPVEALTLAETAAPRIIVLDIMLPGVDGWELLGRLRNHPRTQDVPVIVCSILPMEELALSLGAAAFLQKRVSREALLCALQEQVDGLAKGSR